MNWYEATVYFEAKDRVDAERTIDAVSIAACRGRSWLGRRHKCKRGAIVTAHLVPIPDEEVGA